MENRFGASAPFTIGVEEEFQLVDPSTRELAPAIEAVIGAAPNGSERIARELFQDCVEMRSPVFSNVGALASRLPALRREDAKAAQAAGVGLAASGLHPISDPFAQRFTPGERYERMEEELGSLARLQIIYTLHVHVAVPDGERAIRATNALLRHVPLFVALSANSPFWNGMDTGFASARVKIRDASPRSGHPPTFHSWDEFEDYTNALVAMGNIPDYSWFWWDVRPHPRHGTVELRVPDVQAEPDYAVALAALTQCLVATADDYAPEDARFVSENKWRAIRRGLDARFYDFATKEEKGAREVARDLVARLLKGKVALAVDATGVGAAVVDMLRRSGLTFDAVTITGGDTESQSGWDSYRVPKRDLVGGLQVLLQSGRLKIARSLEHAETLRAELLNFRVKINIATAHDSYEAWREGDHDDLVLATALAAWRAQKREFVLLIGRA